MINRNNLIVALSKISKAIENKEDTVNLPTEVCKDVYKSMTKEFMLRGTDFLTRAGKHGRLCNNCQSIIEQLDYHFCYNCGQRLLED